MKKKLKKGYFGIGVFQMKNHLNLGTLWRSAVNLNADFIFVIGKRFKREASDTVNAFKKIPLYEYDNFEQFYENIPYSCQLICVEQTDKSKPLSKFKHPRSLYIFIGFRRWRFTRKDFKK